MSDWGLYEIYDAVWGGNGESDDHIVPDPEDAREGTCIVKGKHKKKSHEVINAVSKSAEHKRVENKNDLFTQKEGFLSCSSTKEESSTQILEMDPWCDLQCEKQAASYNLMHGEGGMGNKPVDSDFYKDVKLESAESDLIIGMCKEDPILENGDSILGDGDETLVNNSCHFSLTDICPTEGDLEFFGNEHEDKESCTLLDYGWAHIGNFEDVDKLLRSCDSTFGHRANSSVDELLWPSSSSACVDNSPQGNIQQGRASSSPESRALKGKSQQNELKMEFMPCDYPSLLATCQRDDSKAWDCQQNDSIKNKPLKQESSGHIQELQGNAVNENKYSWREQQVGHNQRSEGTPISEKEDTDISQDIDKVNLYRKQTVGHKQPEKKHKKHLTDKRCMQNMPPIISYSTGFQAQQPLSLKLQTSASSAFQIFPSPVHASQKQLVETGSPRQVYPQFPYIHAGYGYPLHHVPVMPSLSTLRPQADQAQPLFVGYQLPPDVSSQPHHIRKPLEIPLRPPGMTPQEKIEKLRWRQQMQAKLAVEHQQQQFGGQNSSMNNSLVHRQPQDGQHQWPGVSPKGGPSKFLQSSSVESDSLTPRENSSPGSGLTYSDDDGCLEANVLHQLKSVIARLGMKTRLCIRDSLYRLARSAMQRRYIGNDKSNSENSEHIEAVGMCIPIDADQTHVNRIWGSLFFGAVSLIISCAGLNDMETETNPIDRMIAHFLFHKHSMSSAGPVSVVAESSNSTFSMNPQSFSAAPNLWFCRSPAFQSPTEVSIDPTTNLQFTIPGQSPISIAKTGIGCGPQNMNNMKGSSGGSCSASDVLFEPQLCGTSSSMDLQSTEGILVSKHQGGTQNKDSMCPSVKANRLSERETILENSEGLTELRCQNLPEHQGDSKVLPPNSQNMVKPEPLESMEVDMLNTDSDLVDV